MARDRLRVESAPANQSSLTTPVRRDEQDADRDILNEADEFVGEVREGSDDMNMHTSDWETAFADYEAKRASSDALPIGAEGDDEALDACCAAMDHLIEHIPAETIEQLSTKIELALERASGFECICEDYAEAIVADLERLRGSMSGFAFAWLQRWTFLGGDVAFDLTDSGKIQIGWPAYDLSPIGWENEVLLEQWNLSNIPAPQRAMLINERRKSDQYLWEGGIRQLQELLNAVPGGIAALKSVLRVNSKLGRGRQGGE